VSLMEESECVVLPKHLVTLCSVGDCVWIFLVMRTHQYIQHCSRLWDVAIFSLSSIDVWSKNHACQSIQHV
jgi:hypothetical protein